jgi:hypothetical protein
LLQSNAYLHKEDKPRDVDEGERWSGMMNEALGYMRS